MLPSDPHLLGTIWSLSPLRIIHHSSLIMGVSPVQHATGHNWAYLGTFPPQHAVPGMACLGVGSDLSRAKFLVDLRPLRAKALVRRDERWGGAAPLVGWFGWGVDAGGIIWVWLSLLTSNFFGG